MNKKTRFFTLFLVLICFSSVFIKSHAFQPCKSGNSWFLNNKKFSIPMFIASSAILWDGVKVVKGENKDQSWADTVKGSYKGLLGAAALPVLWYLHKLYIYPKEPMLTKKPAGNSPYTFQWLGKRIIKQYYAVKQGNSSDCGYHAIYNAACLKTGHKGKILQEKLLKKQKAKWKNKSKTRGNINSAEAEEIIRQHVPALCAKQKRDGEEPVYLKNNVSIIDNVDSLIQMITVDAFGGIDHHTVRNIRRFQRQKMSQIIILNDSMGDVYENHNGVWHWLAVKLEYVDKKTVQLSVIDSLNGDMSKHPIFDKLYHLFVNTNVLEVE